MKVYLQRLKIILHSNTYLFFLTLLIFIVTFCMNKIGLKSVYNGSEKEFIGVIKQIKKDNDYQTITLKAKEKILVTTSSDETYLLGNKIKVYGDLTKPKENKNYYLFNYRNYLKSKEISWILKPSYIQVLSHSSNPFIKIKQKILNLIDKRKCKKYYKTFLIGDQSSVDDDLKRAIRRLGCSHLFSLSGMHFSYLYIILNNLFDKLLNLKKKKVWIILCILGYFLITVRTPSIIRAFLFLTFVQINHTYHLKFTSIQILIYLLLGYLIINPFIIYDLGFIYSFTVSFFILSFKGWIYKGNKLIRTSLVATLSSIPITLMNSFEYNIFSFFINLILTPFISFIFFPLCLLSFVFIPLEPIFSFCIVLLENFILFGKEYLTYCLIFPRIPTIFYIGYLILIWCSLKGIERNNFKFILILGCSFLIHYNILYLDNSYHINILDVGQGDSSLIKLPHNKGNIMIDTGGIRNSNLCKNTILPYLKSKGIRSLDYLILTHGDYDHMGEAICLVNNFKVETVIFNDDSYNKLESELIKLLDNKGIKHYNELEQINLKRNKIYFLNSHIYDNENDNSNVLYFKLNNYKFLFMADAGIKREEDILDKYNLNNIDFLKVGHHGSDTSSGEYFINTIKPANCLISVGESNRYGHPKESVLDILKKCNFYRTDLNGSIEIKLKNNTYKIKKYVNKGDN